MTSLPAIGTTRDAAPAPRNSSAPDTSAVDVSGLIDVVDGSPEPTVKEWKGLVVAAKNAATTYAQFERIHRICQTSKYDKSGCARFEGDDPVRQMCLNHQCPTWIIDFWANARCDNKRFVSALATNPTWGAELSRESNPFGLDEAFFDARETEEVNTERARCIEEMTADTITMERLHELVMHSDAFIARRAALVAWTQDGLTDEIVHGWVDAGVRFDTVAYAYRWAKAGVSPEEATERWRSGDMPPPL